MTSYLGLDAVQAELMSRLLAKKRTLEPKVFRDRAIEIVGAEYAGTVLQKLAKLDAERAEAAKLAAKG